MRTLITCPYDWLMIRATKDCGPTLQRLRRIWGIRCANPTELHDKADKYIATRLLLILALCDERSEGQDVMKILEYADPDNGWKIGAERTELYWARVVLSIASIIRGKMVSEFPNYHLPARSREKASV